MRDEVRAWLRATARQTRMKGARPSPGRPSPGGQGAPEFHEPVMAAEVLECLQPRPGAVVVDGTLGTGGHSLTILPRLLPDGLLIGIDRDGDAVAMAQARLTEFEPQVHVVHDDYRHLDAVLDRVGQPAMDGLLLDVGMSRLQVEDPDRGFSFSQDGPLDMRMDSRAPRTASQLVNQLSVAELTHLFQTYGEERFARRIAARVVTARREARIATTGRLVDVLMQALPPAARRGPRHAATRVFQALRIAVNDELGALQTTLQMAHLRLRPGGRLVVLTYHSLEDRIVKRAFQAGAREGVWRLLTKSPLRPTREEVRRNPRARSAKLRAVEAHG